MSASVDQPALATAPPASDRASDPPVMGTAKRWSRQQKTAAAAVTTGAPCTPVFVRAAIVGRARMPRAALEISLTDGSVLGHVALPNTSAAFDPLQRFWLIGPPEKGAVVALVSEGGSQVILPGSRLQSGSLNEPEWSALACRMLGWQRGHGDPQTLPEAVAAVFGTEDASVDNPRFTHAVKQFRIAAVTVPVLFFAVCFPYLFFIRALLDSGTSPLLLLAFPVVGGTLMTTWAAHWRREVGAEADRIEAGSAQWSKEIAFTQSYWTGMRKTAKEWSGPLPAALR